MDKSLTEDVAWDHSVSTQKVIDTVHQRTGATVVVNVSGERAFISGRIPVDMFDQVRSVITELGIKLDS